MVIRGEKIFTYTVRAELVAACMRRAQTHDKEAARLRRQADALAGVRTTAELESVRLTQHSGDPSVYEYCIDDRTKCSHCKTKQHGGIHGCILSEPEAYYCWKAACQRAFKRASKKDERDYPKLYAAAAKLAKARRRSMGYSRGRRGRRLK